MENTKENASVEKSASENPNPNPNSSSEPESATELANSNPNPNANPPSRTPFTSLGQVDADLALARALQEQERAYMILRMEGDGYGSSESGSYVYEDELEGDDDDVDGDHHIDHGDEEHVNVEGSDYGEDAFDANDEELNPFDFESDEAFARALQDVEEREVAARLMALAGLSDWGVVERRDPVRNSQGAWQEVDPDELSYEELVALGEVVGTESRGLSADTISSLPSVHYKAQSQLDGNTDQCVICRLDYEDGDSLVALSCKHLYHPDCINQWLQINKDLASLSGWSISLEHVVGYDIPPRAKMACTLCKLGDRPRGSLTTWKLPNDWVLDLFQKFPSLPQSYRCPAQVCPICSCEVSSSSGQ